MNLSPSEQTERVRRIGGWFGVVAVLVFCGVLIGHAVFLAPLATLGAWAGPVAVALVGGGVGALLLDWMVLGPQRRVMAALQAELAGRLEWQRRLRHDLRGAMSPALLTADQLLTNADPKVKRAGDMMVQAVERAAALIADHSE